MKILFSIIFLCVVCLFSDEYNGTQGNQHISGHSTEFCEACKKIDAFCS